MTDLEKAQERVFKARRELEQALDKLGKIAIEARAEALRRSWYRVADTLLHQ